MSRVFENTNKIDKPLVQAIKKKIATKLNKIRNKREATNNHRDTITRK